MRHRLFKGVNSPDLHGTEYLTNHRNRFLTCWMPRLLRREMFCNTLSALVPADFTVLFRIKYVACVSIAKSCLRLRKDFVREDSMNLKANPENPAPSATRLTLFHSISPVLARGCSHFPIQPSTTHYEAPRLKDLPPRNQRNRLCIAFPSPRVVLAVVLAFVPELVHLAFLSL